ncbi:MAG: 3-hydroxyacyl-[acyl-carrier-protein] dehydratase FabZ [Deltaproteobacteria bacterium]|jgi:3-hydroxyacyl-[acyl-carrier-protein] dehydratase|nr:3-hydroxyacyl-[acyl-carrier-protein] dehydratase FabZ [Deltaproteobacteria bacterium]
MRFFLLDRIVTWSLGSEAVGIKNVSLSEDFFNDHFPLKPIMPGTLIIEGLAQLSGLLLEETVKKQEGLRVKALMSLIDKAKFRRPVLPGSQLRYHSRIDHVNQLGGLVLAKATVEEHLVADCQLLFSFHQFDNPCDESVRADILGAWLENAESN